jgi:AcrR family transcriptional regulator
LVTRNTQDILLQAAADLFCRKGYSDTSIREVGAKAGVSNSLLYHYFKDKEEMLFQIISATSKDLLDTLNEVDERVKEHLLGLREKLVQHMIIHGMRRRRESKIVVEENYWLTGKRRETIREYQRQIYEIYMKNLQELADRGIIKDLNLTVVAFSLFGVINWFFRWYREKKPLQPEEIADTTLEMLFHGILKNNKEVKGRKNEREKRWKQS